MKVTQLCPSLCNPMGYTVHGILQARIQEWVTFPFSMGSSQPRNQNQVSCIVGGFFTTWATGKSLNSINLFLLHNLWTMNKDLRCSLFISDIKLTQFSSVTQSCPTLWDPVNRSRPGLSVQTNSRTSLRLTSIASVMPSSHLILCCPLLLLSPIPPSIRVFSNESTLRVRWPKYGSFSFSIIPSKEHLRLISFRMDWLDLLAVQGTLKSLLQHHSSKASILRRLDFFIIQLSHPYVTTGKP